MVPVSPVPQYTSLSSQACRHAQGKLELASAGIHHPCTEACPSLGIRWLVVQVFQSWEWFSTTLQQCLPWSSFSPPAWYRVSLSWALGCLLSPPDHQKLHLCLDLAQLEPRLLVFLLLEQISLSSNFLSPPSLFHWPSATPRRPWWLVVGAWYKQLQHCQDTMACSVKLQLLVQYMCNAVFHLSEEEVEGKPSKPLLEDLRTSDVGLHQRLEHVI